MKLLFLIQNLFLPENFVLVDDIKCHKEEMDSILLDSITRVSMIGYFVERV